MLEHESHHIPFLLTAGALCLDFANTLRGRLKPQINELLTSYQDLVAFGEQADLLSAAQAELLYAEAVRCPEAALTTLAQARTVREALYGIFVACAFDQQPDTTDLAILNRALAIALRHRQVIVNVDGFSWGWGEQPIALDRILWPIALSAAELLTSDNVAMVRQCAADDCGVIFLDTSRSHKRRWCSMQTCGNRAKVGRFRARQHP